MRTCPSRSRRTSPSFTFARSGRRSRARLATTCGTAPTVRCFATACKTSPKAACRRLWTLHLPQPLLCTHLHAHLVLISSCTELGCRPRLSSMPVRIGHRPSSCLPERSTHRRSVRELSPHGHLWRRSRTSPDPHQTSAVRSHARICVIERSPRMNRSSRIQAAKKAHRKVCVCSFLRVDCTIRECLRRRPTSARRPRSEKRLALAPATQLGPIPLECGAFTCGMMRGYQLRGLSTLGYLNAVGHTSRCRAPRSCSVPTCACTRSGPNTESRGSQTNAFQSEGILRMPFQVGSSEGSTTRDDPPDRRWQPVGSVSWALPCSSTIQFEPCQLP